MGTSSLLSGLDDESNLEGRARFVRTGGVEICNRDALNSQREIAVDWRAPQTDKPLPLLIFMPAVGVGYLDPWNFNDGQFRGTISELPDALTIIVRSECLQGDPDGGPDLQGFPVERDLLFAPLDLQAVYDRLCGDEADGFEGSTISGSEIPVELVDCSRVALSGTSGGGVTALQLYNDCFSQLSLVRELDAVAVGVAGFLPPAIFQFIGGCPEGLVGPSAFTFSRKIPLFIHAGAADNVVPFAIVRSEWQNVRPPKYLYIRSGAHSINDSYAENLIEDFFGHYLLRSRQSERDFLRGYPDGPFDEQTCFLYQGLGGFKGSDTACDAFTGTPLRFSAWNQRPT
jgi:hypothetical protein